MVGKALASTIPRLDSPQRTRLGKSVPFGIARRIDQMPNGFSLALDLRPAGVGAVRRAGATAGRGLREAGIVATFGDGDTDATAGGGATAGEGAVTWAGGAAWTGGTAWTDGGTGDGGVTGGGVGDCGTRTTKLCPFAAAGAAREPRDASNSSWAATPMSTSAAPNVDQAMRDCRPVLFRGAARDGGAGS
jgi:hypothetical protein